MKRHLYNSIDVIQAASGKAIDRAGCLSAILAADVSAITGSPTASAIEVAVSHCDTETGAYTAVDDPELLVGNGGSIPVEAGKRYLVNLDLIACKRYIKVTATPQLTGGTNPVLTAAYALVLGDKAREP